VIVILLTSTQLPFGHVIGSVHSNKIAGQSALLVAVTLPVLLSQLAINNGNGGVPAKFQLNVHTPLRQLTNMSMP
jgi:hypothetical protein